jgi:SAM-dependent methyltransferase
MSSAISNPLIEQIESGKEFWEARSQMAPFSSGYTDPSVEQLEWDAIQRVLKTHLPTLNDPSVLEIGCHVGYTTKKLSGLLNPCRYEALDVSSGSVEMARHYSQIHGFDSVGFLTASATDVPRDDAAYDLIFSIRCIQNIQSTEGQEQAFSQIHRLLKPGGVAIIAENWIEELSRLNELRSMVGLDPFAQPGHTRFLVREELADQISRDFEMLGDSFFAAAYYFGTRYAKWLDSSESATDLESPHNTFYRDIDQSSFRVALGPALTVLRKRN